MNADNIRRSLDYATDAYSGPPSILSYLQRRTDPVEAQKRKAHADAMQAPLAAAVARYEHVANQSGLVGRIASLHGPRGNSSWRYCEGCDAEGYDAVHPEWPCRTATQIAEWHHIGLDEMYLYRWDTA